MNDILIENIKLKSELQYDILFESTEYHSLDSSTQTFLKECYDMGVNTGIYFHRNEQMLIESMDEGFFDRLKAGAVRAGQGVKNLSGFGSQTADSKDAGVDSLLNNFKQKFEKAKQTQGQGSNPNADALKDKIVDDIEILDKRVVNDPTPAPDPKTAEDIVVKNPGIPKSLKDKIIQGIRENPGKIKFLLAAASFGAGVAAATYSLGNPIAIKAAGAAVNGIGNAILAKIQGRGTGDAVMSGLTQGVAGAALAGAGAATVNAISSYIDQAGEVSPNAFQVTKQKAANTGPKDTLGRPKALFRENKESMFVKSYNNTYTLKKSLNENIEEKWNESVEETLEEALNAAQQKAYDEFLIDLGKMFNKSKDEVIPFMQSQGTRFKNVLDYLNQNVTPTQAPTAPAPEQPVQQPNQVKPSLAKYINGIKGSALFAGDLAARIQKTIDFPVDKDATKNVRSMIELRTFLKSLNGILNTNSANYRKQIGDPSVLLQQVNEDIKEYSSLAKQISDVMPSLVGATFELRQMYGKRQSSAPGGKAPAGAVPPVIKEEDIKLGGSLGQAKSNLSVEELSRAKFFLSKLVDIGLLVKSINVAQADQVQMKNLYKNLLELANLVVNKNVKGIKLNKKIDSAFQGKDILGPNAVDKKQSPVKQGPGDIFKEGKKNNFKLR